MAAVPEPSIVALAESMAERADELGAEIADLLQREIEFYRNNVAVIGVAEVRRSCAANAHYVFEALAGPDEPNVSAAVETGLTRAELGVPITAVSSAYRIGFRYMWEATVAEARRRRIPAETILDAAAYIMQAQDDFTRAMLDAYREQLTRQLLRREQDRSALVEAVLFGRITDTRSLWDAADLLRLPTSGPFVVVAAQVREIGRAVLPDIESRLDARDIRSAWRLLPDQQVGIVALRGPARDNLLDVLRAAAVAPVGVSAPFGDLTDTSEALRLARIALVGNAPDDDPIRVFDDAPLALAAVSAPELMRRVGTNVLGGLDTLPPGERAVLLETFDAWLAADGSTSTAASAIFVHPNTVRHRLRRLEERTGRSLSRPRDVAELCLAVEVRRRLD